MGAKVKAGGAKICEPGGKGLVLPIFEGEQEIPNGLRGLIYSIVMIYFFLGVSIVADTFMGSIEAVTSRKRQVRVKTGRVITVRVWNDTVANLTLMALGSSAPEILLSVIELLKNNMYSGELGPATIVGSAAFNLLVIIALCIMVIPSTETRQVQERGVFFITLAFSVFAYLWLVVILSVITPDVVDIQEGIVTFACFFLLVTISWMCDTGKFDRIIRGSQARGNGTVSEEDISRLCDLLGSHGDDIVGALRRAVAARPALARQNYSSAKSIEELRWNIDQYREVDHSQRKSRATRRIEATRVFTGGRKQGGRENFRRTWCLDGEKGTEEVSSVRVQFASDRQVLSPEVSEKVILLVRAGDASHSVHVDYCVHLFKPDASLVSTVFTEASENSGGILLSQLGDEVVSGTLLFEAHGKAETVRVQRPTVGNTPQDFVVRLVGVRPTVPTVTGTVGSISTCHVFTGAESQPGKLAFTTERLMVQGTSQKQVIEVIVKRTEGCSGVVSCSYHTERLTAMPGYDYTEKLGTLEFDEGQTEQVIELEILKKGINESSDELLLVLTDAQGGATFDSHDDGGVETSILTITIQCRTLGNSPNNRAIRMLDKKINFDGLRLGSHDCKEQIIGAIYCNGSPEEQEEASCSDWIFHIIALPWKLVFTLVPPTSYCGGWACFCVSLCLIGVVTAVIGDLAELFGCVLDVPDAVTAITFVAMGTSMPDLFASQSAALQDPTADASIVNVTGSNSVNVFLGLGLPWTMGAIYWRYKTEQPSEWLRRYPEIANGRSDTVFVVPSGNLAFSVCVFTCCSVGALVILTLRRKMLDAELGGPLKLKVVASLSLVALWFSFLTLSSWQFVRSDDASIVERLVVIFSVACIAGLFVITSMIMLLCYRPEEPDWSRTSTEADTTRKGVLDPDEVKVVGLLSVEEPLSEARPDGQCGNSPTSSVLDDVDPSLKVASPDEAAGPQAYAAAHPVPLQLVAVNASPPAMLTYEAQPLAPVVDQRLFDDLSQVDTVPVQPMTSAAVTELMAPVDLQTMGDGDYGFQPSPPTDSLVYPRGRQPVVRLPNLTQDALLIGMHALSRTGRHSL